MKTAIYIILGLQTLSVIGFVSFTIYLNRSNRKYKRLKTALQDSINQIMLDQIERDKKAVKPQSDIDLPNIYLN